MTSLEKNSPNHHHKKAQTNVVVTRGFVLVLNATKMSRHTVLPPQQVVWRNTVVDDVAQYEVVSRNPEDSSLLLSPRTFVLLSNSFIHISLERSYNTYLILTPGGSRVR